MVKYLISAALIGIVAASCLKNRDSGCPYSETDITAPLSEQQALATFLDTNGIEATKDSSGFYYTVVTPGTGTDSIGLCSLVRVTYSGSLVNGEVFDKQDQPVDFVLGRFIEGWKKGMRKIKRGGKVKLYIPPSLGYGNQDFKNDSGRIVIPKNSILLFDLNLIDYTAAN